MKPHPKLNDSAVMRNKDGSEMTGAEFDQMFAPVVDEFLALEGDYITRVKALCGDHGDFEGAVINLALAMQRHSDPEVTEVGWRAMEDLADSGNNPARRNLAAQYFELDCSPEKDLRAFELFSVVRETETQDQYLKGLATAGMAACHLDGRGVAQDVSKAHRLFEEAADLGVAEAAFEIAQYHNYTRRDGQRGAAHVARAVHFYERAAELGHARSMLHLALMYLSGRATPPRLNAPYELLTRASELGEIQATQVLVALAQQQAAGSAGAQH
jgi:TPR repeat protein